MKNPVTGGFLSADPSIQPTERTFTCLEDMQAAVGGYIEAVYVHVKPGGPEVTLWINEEGKLQDLKHNVRATRLFRIDRETDDCIVGDAFLLGPPTDEGEETSF